MFTYSLRTRLPRVSPSPYLASTDPLYRLARGGSLGSRLRSFTVQSVACVFFFLTSTD